MCVVCRTFKNLLYANVATLDHFTMLLHMYHAVTHRGGKVLVRDRHVLRRLTNRLEQDSEVLEQFCLLPDPVKFHPDDVNKVFVRYLKRVETMVGNEICRQLLDDLRLEGVDRLESLRQVKCDRSQQVKTSPVCKVVTGVSKVKKKGKRRKRKRKKGR